MKIRWAFQNMTKWIPGVVGCATGITVGVVCLFQPAENIPIIVYQPVVGLSGLLRRLFMPNSDPMAAFLFEIPMIVLLPGLVGGLAGISVQGFFALIQRITGRG